VNIVGTLRSELKQINQPVNSYLIYKDPIVFYTTLLNTVVRLKSGYLLKCNIVQIKRFIALKVL
jgi:hypothetical protein